MSGALKQEGHADYLLKPVDTSVWITVNNISVYIRRTDEGVAVSLYPVGREMDDEIVGTWALFSEAEYEDEHWDRDDGQGTREDWSRLVRQGKDGNSRRPEGGDS